MIRKVLLACAAAMALASASAPAMAQGYANRITLFSDYGQRGDARSFADAQSNLANSGFGDRAESVRIDGGAWQVCENANFTGLCVTLTQGADDLSRTGLVGKVSSIRPVAGGLAGGPSGHGNDQNGYDQYQHDGPDYPPPGAYPPSTGPAFPPQAGPGGPPQPNFRSGGWDRPDAVGHSSAYFINPRLNGRPVTIDSYRGGRGAEEAAADRFCNQVGYREGAYYSVDQQRWGAALQDVLCVR